MYKTFAKIKTELKENELVKNSLLGYSDVWKTSHYNTLSNIINESLMKNPILKGEKKFQIGNTISAITLKRFFEDQISDSASTDLRFIKTLDKICIFIGYENFNDFIQKNKNEGLTLSEDIKEDINTEDQNSYIELIRGCAECEFKLISGLPKINMHETEKFVIIDSPYYNRISNYMRKLENQKYLLNLNRNSNYEIFNIEMKSQDEQSIVISTSEFWNLNFIDEEGNTHHYHTMNAQNYFLRKTENGNWKIWDNYNPNVWDLTDKI